VHNVFDRVTVATQDGVTAKRRFTSQNSLKKVLTPLVFSLIEFVSQTKDSPAFAKMRRTTPRKTIHQ
jgi:predicted transcriptional regulator